MFYTSNPQITCSWIFCVSINCGCSRSNPWIKAEKKYILDFLAYPFSPNFSPVVFSPFRPFKVSLTSHVTRTPPVADQMLNVDRLRNKIEPKRYHRRRQQSNQLCAVECNTWDRFSFPNRFALYSSLTLGRWKRLFLNWFLTVLRSIRLSCAVHSQLVYFFPNLSSSAFAMQLKRRKKKKKKTRVASVRDRRRSTALAS